MTSDETQIETARLLVSRLERMSADSYWAHQASGLRGSLLRCLAEVETGDQPGREGLQRLESLVEKGFEILERAAREIRPPEVQG